MLLCPTRPIFVRDLIDEGAIVFLTCQACGRIARLAGPYLLGRLGVDRRVRGVLHGLTCEKCGMLGDMTLKFDRDDLSGERLRRGLKLHDDWPTTTSDLADFDDGARGRTEDLCNLYSDVTASTAMRQLFKVDPSGDRLGNAEPRPAIFPKCAAPVVRLDAQGNREIVDMSWGFLTPA